MTDDNCSKVRISNCLLLCHNLSWQGPCMPASGSSRKRAAGTLAIRRRDNNRNVDWLFKHAKSKRGVLASSNRSFPGVSDQSDSNLAPSAQMSPRCSPRTGRVPVIGNFTVHERQLVFQQSTKEVAPRSRRS